MDNFSDKSDCDNNLPCKICCRDKPLIKGTASGLIDDIMKKYLCSKAGQGSSCSLFSNPKGSVYSMDKRLLYWSQILEDRKRIACRIQRVTGKRLSHVLYNQTEEHRDVQNVKRVIDFAQRLNPSNLSKRKTVDIKQTLFETLPRSERLQTPNFEIVGTPKVAMAEQWLRNCNNSFLRSSYLQRKLKSTTTDGTNLLEFYPDIARLEVVGRRIHKHHKPTAELISNFELSVVSSISKTDSWQEFPEFCLQINDTVLRSDMNLAENLTFNLDFICTPFLTTTQTACKVKNIGKKPVYLSVRRVKPNGAAYLPSYKKVFHFNINSIRLGYGESIGIEVTFHSDERRVQEDQYYLLVDPNFFGDSYKIVFELKGNCYIPQDYFDSMIGDLLDLAISEAIPRTVCDPVDNRKGLTNMELFEKQNPGFKCEPEDLKRFCEIYRQIKRKHHPNKWNMSLQCLKELIEGVEDYTQRTAYFEIFRKTLREMRRRVPKWDSNINFLLARSVIVTNFDKWEKKAQQIQHAVATTDVDLLVIKMPFETVIEQIKLCNNEKEKRQIILHNALYIQMFCCVCELAEDIVSYVENCLKMSAY